MPDREPPENPWTSGPSIFERAPTPLPHRRTALAATRVRDVVLTHTAAVLAELETTDDHEERA